MTSISANACVLGEYDVGEDGRHKRCCCCLFQNTENSEVANTYFLSLETMCLGRLGERCHIFCRQIYT